ncbi:site-specific integrase [Acinetobacter sp. YH12126]|uniref:site-specific integrase n=1 Tax=Acinetobacter sp. YH12126 TaxID=2601111 RepID=UPI001C5505B4|nr:site-specific integrase [Acinetobacter sp. YH12126]
MIENSELYDYLFQQDIGTVKNNNFAPINITWLKNCYTDDVWELRPHIITDDKAKYTITWDLYGLENYSGVFHRWNYWKNAAKELGYWIMEAPESKCNTTSTLAGICRNIRQFYEWLCFERHCFDLAAVKNEDIVSFCEHISLMRLKESTVLSKLIVISYAYSLRRYLKESLSFDPFKTKKTYLLAKAYSTQNEHTPTLYPKEIFSLLNHAIKLVKESEETLILLRKYMQIHADSTIYHRSMYLKFYKQTGFKSSELQSKVRALYGAAVTIIFILLAERKHELSLTKETDVLKLLNNEIDILIGLEKKTAKTKTGKRTERAVIQEVKDAMLVILELTSYNRIKSKNETILLKLPFSHSDNGKGNKTFYLTTNGLYVILEQFAKSAKFERIKLRPHMFRRAYAMLWTWRFEIGDLEELSLMLKHNSTTFTKKYTDDENIWEFMGQTEQDLAFDLLNRVFQGKVILSGKISDTLERYSRLIQAKSNFLDSQSIADFVDEFIQSNNMRIVAHSDGYCFIQKNGLDLALCRTDGIGLDPLKRTDSLCLQCPNFTIDNSRKEHWQNRIKLHQEVIDGSKNEKLIEHSTIFINQAEKMLSSILVKEKMQGE